MKKIIVVGTSGSGKTTLARTISDIIGAEHLELDSIYNQSNWTLFQPTVQVTTDSEFNDRLECDFLKQ